MSPIRLVIFDIAGTIIEDHGEVLSSFTLALMKNGIPAEENGLSEWKGASKREVIRSVANWRQCSRSEPEDCQDLLGFSPDAGRPLPE